MYASRGGSRGGVLGVRTPPFGGPPNFIKREKTSRACARKGRILVLNSYLDPPLSEILYPPLARGHGYNSDITLYLSLGSFSPQPGQGNMGVGTMYITSITKPRWVYTHYTTGPLLQLQCNELFNAITLQRDIGTNPTLRLLHIFHRGILSFTD